MRRPAGAAGLKAWLLCLAVVAALATGVHSSQQHPGQASPDAAVSVCTLELVAGNAQQGSSGRRLSQLGSLFAGLASTAVRGGVAAGRIGVQASLAGDSSGSAPPRPLTPEEKEAQQDPRHPGSAAQPRQWRLPEFPTPAASWTRTGDSKLSLEAPAGVLQGQQRMQLHCSGPRVLVDAAEGINLTGSAQAAGRYNPCLVTFWGDAGAGAGAPRVLLRAAVVGQVVDLSREGIVCARGALSLNVTGSKFEGNCGPVVLHAGDSSRMQVHNSSVSLTCAAEWNNPQYELWQQCPPLEWSGRGDPGPGGALGASGSAFVGAVNSSFVHNSGCFGRVLRVQGAAGGLMQGCSVLSRRDQRGDVVLAGSGRVELRDNVFATQAGSSVADVIGRDAVLSSQQDKLFVLGGSVVDGGALEKVERAAGGGAGQLSTLVAANPGFMQAVGDGRLFGADDNAYLSTLFKLAPGARVDVNGSLVNGAQACSRPELLRSCAQLHHTAAVVCHSGGGKIVASAHGANVGATSVADDVCADPHRTTNFAVVFSLFGLGLVAVLGGIIFLWCRQRTAVTAAQQGSDAAKQLGVANLSDKGIAVDGTCVVDARSSTQPKLCSGWRACSSLGWHEASLVLLLGLAYANFVGDVFAAAAFAHTFALPVYLVGMLLPIVVPGVLLHLQAWRVLVCSPHPVPDSLLYYAPMQTAPRCVHDFAETAHAVAIFLVAVLGFALQPALLPLYLLFGTASALTHRRWLVWLHLDNTWSLVGLCSALSGAPVSIALVAWGSWVGASEVVIPRWLFFAKTATAMLVILLVVWHLAKAQLLGGGVGPLLRRAFCQLVVQPAGDAAAGPAEAVGWAADSKAAQPDVESGSGVGTHVAGTI